MRFSANGNVIGGALAGASDGAAGSVGSAACRPGAGMILSAGLSIRICSAESGLSENLKIVDPVHSSGAVFGEAALRRQLSSMVEGFLCFNVKSFGYSLIVNLSVCNWTSFACIRCE